MISDNPQYPPPRFKPVSRTKPPEADWVVTLGAKVVSNDKGREVRYSSFSGCEGWIKRRREEGFEADYQIGWAYK